MPTHKLRGHWKYYGDSSICESGLFSPYLFYLFIFYLQFITIIIIIIIIL